MIHQIGEHLEKKMSIVIILCIVAISISILGIVLFKTFPGFRVITSGTSILLVAVVLACVYSEHTGYGKIASSVSIYKTTPSSAMRQGVFFFFSTIAS